MSRWTDFVKEYAKKHNTTYGCALSMPDCSAEYKKAYPKKVAQKKRTKAQKLPPETLYQDLQKAEKLINIQQELLEKYPPYAEERQRKREVESMGAEDEDIYPVIENPDVLQIELKAYMAKTQKEASDAMEQVKRFVLTPAYKKLTPRDRKSLDHSIDTIYNKKVYWFNKQIEEERAREKQEQENIKLIIQEKAQRGRKKKYATPEEAHKAKLEKTKESTKRKRAEKKTAKGIFDPFTKVAKYAKDTIVAPVQQSVQSTIDTGKALVFGRTDLPPNVRDIVSKYGDLPVNSITLGRTPVPSVITSAINAVSLGQFSKKFANTPYDQLFHLFIVFGTSQGNFLFEKNAVINATTTIPKNAETRVITPIPQGLTINSILDNTKRLMGDKFLPYSAVNNNCQDFISSILRANNIGTSDDLNWVKQDTEQLFSNQSYLQQFTNKITDLGAKVDVLQQGAGVDTIDFEDIKWGSLTKQLQAYNRQHNTDLDLHQFSMKILANPEDYQKRTIKRARFYINVLNKKSGTGIKKPNKWIEFVKDFSSKNNMKYSEAIKHPATKTHYKTGKPAKKLSKKLLGKGMPTTAEQYSADVYNMSELGATGGKKYISL